MDIPNILYNPNGIIRESQEEDSSTPLDWNELTMKEKAAYIRMGVANGYKDIDSIKEVYNEFKCGGNLYKEGGPKKQEYIYDVLPRLLKEAGLNIRVTSGYRKPGAVGTAGNRSWHPRHGAVDIVPMGKTTFEDIEEVLHTNPTIVKYMLDNGFGLLDESGRSQASKDTMKRTGATGAHFHIGRDSKPAALYKQRAVQYSPMATTDNRKVYFSNPHLPIPEDQPQPKQVVSIQTPAKPLLNTTLDSNISTNQIVMQQEEPVVDKQIPEVVVTAQAPRRYTMPNPQELLDQMNSMMVPYELPEVPKPITATERLAQLNQDKNSLLQQDLENSILRANRFGTPLDEVKLARDVKDLQFYRNMAASGGKLFKALGDPLVDTANAHIYDGTTEDSQQMNDDYIYTAAPSQYDFQVTAEAPTVYWDGFNWIGFNDLGQRVTKGPDFNPSGARIIENPQEFENARLTQARRKDINGTHRFTEDIKNFTNDLVMMPAGDILAEPLSTVGTKIISKIAKNIFKKGANNTAQLVDNILMHNDNVRFQNIVDNPQSITVGDEITNKAIKRGRNKLLNWIESPFYKQRIMDEPLYTQSQDIVEDASQLIKNADINLEDRYVLNPTGETNGITQGNAVQKTILNNGTELIDADTGLTINIADDLSFNADDTTLHELLHYMTNNSKGSPSTTIVNGDWLSHPETHYDAINKIFRSKSSRWQNYILDQNDSLLPKYDKVVKLVMENPEEAIKYLKNAGRSETDAINAVNSLKSRYKYLYDIQEQRAFLQELFLSKIQPNLKNPNSVKEIEQFLIDNPAILENSPSYQQIQEIRPGTLKDYAKYFSAALSTLPIINKSIQNDK